MGMSTGDPNRRILVVDDNQSVHQDYKRILVKENEDSEVDDMAAELFGDEAVKSTVDISFDVDFALQGKESIGMIKKSLKAGHPYAVAFVDMRMPPGWDGLETIERIWEVDPEIQCVICTAYSDYELDQIVERLGRSDKLLFLKKPFDMAEVAQMAIALSEKWNMTALLRYNMKELDLMVKDRTHQLIEMRKHVQEEKTHQDHVNREVDFKVRRKAKTALGKLGLLWMRLHKQLDPQDVGKTEKLWGSLENDIAELDEVSSYFKDDSSE